MAPKKNWIVAWRGRHDRVLYKFKWHNASLKEIYDKINGWNKDTIVNEADEPYYFLEGEAE